MERVEKQHGDMLLVMLLVVILGVGVALLFSSSYPFSSRAFKDPLFLVKRQLLWAALGAAAAFVVSLTPLELFRRSMPLILLGTLVVALLPFLPGLGTSVLGSRRWITVFGFSFQPSELVKIDPDPLPRLLLRPARRRGRHDAEHADSAVRRHLRLLRHHPAAERLFHGDLRSGHRPGDAVHRAGAPPARAARDAASPSRSASFSSSPASTACSGSSRSSTCPSHSSGTGYQVVTAKAALVSGGLWGKGLGRSAAKLGPLPMSYSDFIYTMIGEETGLLGSLFVLALFALLVWRGLPDRASGPQDRFSYYVAFGVTTALCLQALLNMAVAVGLVPTTGVTLPVLLRGGLVAVHHPRHVRPPRESVPEGIPCLTRTRCGSAQDAGRRGGAAALARWARPLLIALMRGVAPLSFSAASSVSRSRRSATCGAQRRGAHRRAGARPFRASRAGTTGTRCPNGGDREAAGDEPPRAPGEGAEGVPRHGAR